MHRFHLPPERCRDSLLELSREDSHHAAGVLRVRPGEAINIFDGAGKVLSGVIESVRRGSVAVRIDARRLVPPPECAVTLVQALVKARAMDTILQKATELGVSRIVPLAAARSVAQVGGDDVENKVARWQTTIVEAGKQCGAAWLPKVDEPTSLGDWLLREAEAAPDLLLVASLETDAAHLRPVFDRHVAARGCNPRTVAVCVGPEGDFAPDELAALRERGAVAVSLGPLTLRAETAALAALAIIGHELRTPRD